MDYYIVMECGKCNEPMRLRFVTLLEHNGIPEVSFDAAAQTRFDCDNCGTSWYTGDFDYFSEDEI